MLRRCQSKGVFILCLPNYSVLCLLPPTGTWALMRERSVLWSKAVLNQGSEIQSDEALALEEGAG